MATYVSPIQNTNQRTFLCYLVADTKEELADIARAIGAPRFPQYGEAGVPYYEITKQKRRFAIRAGAEEISFQAIVEAIEKLRDRSLENEIPNKKQPN